MSKQHQKSEGVCNNREELTGKKLPFPNYPFREWNPGPCKLASGHIPLSYPPVLWQLCNKGFTGLTWYGKKSPPCENFGSLRHASKPPPTTPRIWRCGMLLPLVAGWGIDRAAEHPQNMNQLGTSTH